jgi:hypothetical protein
VTPTSAASMTRLQRPRLPMPNPNISILQPLNIDRHLWRYVSLLKFVDLLH